MDINVFLFNPKNIILSAANVLSSLIRMQSRVLFLCDSAEEMEEIDRRLWLYAQLSFLPHATIEDKFPEQQPVLISTKTSDYTVNSSKNIMYLVKSRVPLRKFETNFEKIMLILEKQDVSNIDADGTLEEVKEILAQFYDEEKKWLTYQKPSGDWIKRPIT